MWEMRLELTFGVDSRVENKIAKREIMHASLPIPTSEPIHSESKSINPDARMEIIIY